MQLTKELKNGSGWILKATTTRIDWNCITELKEINWLIGVDVTCVGLMYVLTCALTTNSRGDDGYWLRMGRMGRMGFKYG